jgi:hypothetical protein
VCYVVCKTISILEHTVLTTLYFAGVKNTDNASGPLIPGCVGWFFESVVERILNSGCQLKIVVGFKFYSSGCTSYPGCFCS